MTREAIPPFDLYAELEVSRSASVATIEAAYRSLVKVHHPDVLAGSGGAGSGGAGGDGDDKIKRINLARDWLTNEDRRRRYDRALGIRPSAMTSSEHESHGGSGSEGASGSRRRGGNATSRGAGAFGAGGTGASGDEGDDPSWASYGPNAAEVKQFLADLRLIDYARALEVRGGIQAANAAGLADARAEALRVGQSRRLSEWLFSRNAAAVIVRTRLGEAGRAGEVVEPLADAAGAIAIRDLLVRSDFELLLLPWTWRGDHILGHAVTPRSMAAVSLPRHARGSGPGDAAGQGTFGGGGGQGAGYAGGPAGTGGSGSAGGAAGPAGPTVTPARRTPGQRSGRSGRMPVLALGASGFGLVIAVVALGAALLNGPRGAVGPTALPGGSTSSLAPLATPSPTSTIVPSATPTAMPSATPPPGSIDPVTLAQLQAGASQTLATLRSAAAHGAVATAQLYLGGSAPGLLASGLKRATFPTVTPADVAVVRAGNGTGTGFVATAAGETLTSADGITWTLDYGERPLARFGPSGKYTLYFLSGSDPHEIIVIVTVVSISRSSVTLGFSWSYGPDAKFGNDGPYFSGDQLLVTGLTLGTTAVPVSDTLVSELGAQALTGSVKIAGSALQPGTTIINIAVADPHLGRIENTIPLKVH